MVHTTEKHVKIAASYPVKLRILPRLVGAQTVLIIGTLARHVKRLIIKYSTEFYLEESALQNAQSADTKRTLPPQRFPM